MRAQGWEYWSPAIRPKVDLVEFAAKFGFGFAPAIGKQAELQAALSDDDARNSAFEAGLAEADRLKYESDLEGDFESPTPGGCRGEAVKAVLGPSSPILDRNMVEALGETLDLIDNDPRIARALNEDWGACMALAGIKVTNRSQLIADARSRFVAAVASTQDLAKRELAEAKADASCYRDVVEPEVESVEDEYMAKLRERLGL